MTSPNGIFSVRVAPSRRDSFNQSVDDFIDLPVEETGRRVRLVVLYLFGLVPAEASAVLVVGRHLFSEDKKLNLPAAPRPFRSNLPHKKTAEWEVGATKVRPDLFWSLLTLSLATKCSKANQI